jgi:hypothetical protein
MDKNQAVIEYLSSCPAIAKNPLFFNFAKAEDNNKQLVAVATDKKVERPYIDGSVLKRYTFTIIDYRSVIYQAVVKEAGYPNENVEELLDVQSIIDWIEEQNSEYNFPDFGEDCVIDEIKALTDTPRLNGVDNSASPALAKYSVSIQILYLDTSKRIWK